MSKSKLIGVVAVAVVVVATGLWMVNKVSTTPDRIRVGYMKIAAHLPVVVAHEEGVFQEFGLDVGELEAFSDTPALMQALLTDRIDVAFQVTPDVAWQTLDGVERKLHIYFVAQSTSASPIDGLYAMSEENDMKGKVIGVFPGPTASALMAEIMREHYGLSPRDYELRPIPPPLQLTLLRSGEIDALFTYEPLGTLARERAAAVTLIEGPVEKYVIDPWNGGVGVFGESIVRYRPKVACRFAAAIAESINRLSREPDIAAEQMVALQPGLTPDIAKKVPLTSYFFVDGISAPADLTLPRSRIQELLDNQLAVYTSLGILEERGRLDYLEGCEE